MTTHVIINDMAQVDAIGDFFFSASALSAASVDLSRRGISQLPLDFPGYEKLEVQTHVQVLSLVRMFVHLAVPLPGGEPAHQSS